MSEVILTGATSGTITVVPPAIAGTRTITLPAETGTVRTTASSGTVLQVVHYQTTAHAVNNTGGIPVDTSIPQNNEGSEFLSLAITPKSATSYLIIEVVLQAYITTTSTACVALFQDSNANALACILDTIPSGNVRAIPLRYKMTSGTTSSTTFKVRAGGETGVGAHLYINGSTSALMGGTSVCSITITEVVA